MPARSERVYLFPSRNGAPGWTMPLPSWWDRGEFIRRYQTREIDLGNPIDANFVYVLNSAEAVSWNRECVSRFAADPMSRRPDLLEEQSRFEANLEQSQWVLVESYEWESGLE